MSLRAHSSVRAISGLAAGTALTVLLAACAGTAEPAESDAAGPVTIRNCDREVAVAEPPQRIVSLTQQSTELLLALGLEDRMVGTAWWNEPVRADLAEAEKAVPRLSDRAPSFETVLEAEPDFVVAGFDAMFTDEMVAPRDRFAEFGIETWLSPAYCHGEQAALTDPFELSDLYREINDLATVFGVPERGTALVEELKADVATARAEVAELDLGRDFSAAFWYGTNDAPYMAGATGAPGVMTRALGIGNIYDDNAAMWPQVNWEDVIERNPDLLVMADLSREGEGQSMQQKIDYVSADPAISQMPAVKAESWIPMRGMELDPTINTVEGIRKLADYLVERYGKQL